MILWSILALLIAACSGVATSIAMYRKRTPRLWIPVFGVTASVAGTVVLLLFHFGYFGSNFRAIEDQNCYRSAQLDPATLEAIVKTHQIKTVVNLRGSSRQQWYRKEQEVLQKLNVTLRDIELDNNDLPPASTLVELIGILKNSPRPILLHCRQGVDRTGVAAVLYQNIVENKPLNTAVEKEFSFWSGHIATSDNDSGDRFFDLYRETSCGNSMEQWIETTYPTQHAIALESQRSTASLPWINQPYRLGPIVWTPFKLLGVLGAALFACRWFVQAYYSRLAGRPVTPLNFWLMSILGSTLMLFYFMFSAKQDIVGIISNFFPATVAVYNAVLEVRHQRKQKQSITLATPLLGSANS